ncbi:hypothetical protein V6U89_25310 [Micromonospora sp. CPCC 206171]
MTSASAAARWVRSRALMPWALKKVTRERSRKSCAGRWAIACSVSSLMRCAVLMSTSRRGCLDLLATIN